MFIHMQSFMAPVMGKKETEEIRKVELCLHEGHGFQLIVGMHTEKRHIITLLKLKFKNY